MVLIEKLVKGTKIYKDLYKEHENYIIENKKRQEKIITLKNDLKKRDKEVNEIIESSNEIISNCVLEKNKLQEYIAKLEKKVDEKESARRKLASSNGGLQKKIIDLNKKILELEDKIEFLKSHRRSPSREEIKNYELNRKRLLKENK